MRRAIMTLAAGGLFFAAGAEAAGDVVHSAGRSGDWSWKEVQGYFSAQTAAQEAAFSVFCGDADARGGVSFSVALDGAQEGEKLMRLRFDGGKPISVIAVYGSFTARDAGGEKIMRRVMSGLRGGGAVAVSQKDAKTATFSLAGADEALRTCP